MKIKFSLFDSEEIRSMEKKLLYEKEASKKRKIKSRRLFLLLLFVFVVISVCLLFFHKKEEPLKEIERPSFGEEKNLLLQVSGLSNEIELPVTIHGALPEDEEKEKIFTKAFSKLEKRILGENTSFSETAKPLNLDLDSVDGITVSYTSRTPDVLTDYGVFLVETETPVPYEMEIHMSLGETEKIYFLSGMFCMNKSSEEDELQALLTKLDENEMQEKSIRLPEYLGDRALTFTEKKTDTRLIILFLLAVLLYIPVSEKERLKEALKKRERELDLTYKDLVQRLYLLVQSGLSIRMAWIRISEDYLKRREKGLKKNYAYEELLISVSQMKSGMPEVQCYEEYAARIERPSYRKLCNLLTQSVKRGAVRLTDELWKEQELSMLEWKEKVLRQGEEASTKALFPMMLMLLVIIIILITPAFLSFY